MLNPNIISKTRQLLNIFKIGGQPAGLVMSIGQVEIAACIMLKLNPRAATLGPTGYGKSVAVSMGVIYRVVFFKEDFVIGAEKYDTSDIIMKEIINHLFDNSFFQEQLELDKDTELDRLKRERKKTRLTFRRGGSIEVVSLHGDEDDVSAAIGEHKSNIILDESPLLTPGKYLKVLKILAGTGTYDETFLFELGNAVGNNHFKYNIKSNPNYYKIDISLEQAILEGRLDERSVEEARGLPHFKEFYECIFPDEDEIDSKGYRQLLTTPEVQRVITEKNLITDEPMKMGVDVAAGGDYNVYCIRQGNKAWFETWNRSNDTMTNVNETIRIIDKYSVPVLDEDGNPKKDTSGNIIKRRLLKPENIFLDDIGIGRGCTDRLMEMGYNVNGVSVGERAMNPGVYKNIKAENYWLAAQWIKQTKMDTDTQETVFINKLVQSEYWDQLTWIKHKVSTDKVTQIEPKDELKKRKGKSPDFVEAFMLSFTQPAAEPNFTWL